MIINTPRNLWAIASKDRECLVLFFVSILLILIFGASCCKITDPTDNDDSNNHFAIYFLADTTLKIWDIQDKDLASLELQDEPWIFYQDIRFYDWSTHYIYLNGLWKDYFPVNQSNGLFESYLNERPFIVTSDGANRYIGYIHNMGSSGSFNPAIDEVSHKVGQPDIIHLWWIFAPYENPCNNEKVKQALIGDDLFHAGIEAKIDTTVPIHINNSDTCRIRYTYSLTNKDKDNLYVLDAEKAGDEVFDYFNIGPTFYNTDTGQYYYCDDAGIYPSPEDWNLEGWYTLLQTGGSILRTRTVRINQHLQPGEYYFAWNYHSPSSNKLIQTRETSEGRLWMGSAGTPIYAFELSNNTLPKTIELYRIDSEIQWPMKNSF